MAKDLIWPRYINVKTRKSPAAWFNQFPPINPPDWDGNSAWCLRHYAPIVAIPDPARRAAAERRALLDLSVTFASVIRDMHAPTRIGSADVQVLMRELSPVCCWLGDGHTQAVILAAATAAMTY